MAQILKNNVSGVLGLALGASATSMTLLDASSFPTPPEGDFYLLTLIGLNANGQEASWEIVKVTGKASNTLTVVRAQEGTTAAAWPVATTVQLRLTAGSVVTPDVAALKEPTIAAGATSQYWRGDKSWRDFFTDVRAATLTGLSTVTNGVISATDTVLGALGKLQKQVSDNLTMLTSHTGSTSNPHSVTKAQVGLGNVDNTSDASKPISTAVQTALDAKQATLVSGANIKTLNGEPLLGAGNLVLKLAADQPSAVSYTYDASGRVETTTETLPTGTRTTTVTYNEAGQVKTVAVTLGTSTRTTQYAYDQYGVLTGTTSTES